MERRIGTPARPLRVAVVGAGPAGFYTAEALLKQPELHCSIDLFNRFPAPFGLVRDGVAPDHQAIKSVARIYDRIAADPRVRYFGNVTFGSDLRHGDLKRMYDQIVYAVGAQADRRMGIPGEDLAGSLPASAFVGWYNGHPDYCALQCSFDHERVVVVGNGNVAMDVARILVKAVDELAGSDIADYALARLRQSAVREVVLLGRRGPTQAAFTTAELKELGQLPGVDLLVDPADLELDEASAASLAGDAVAVANMKLLHAYAARSDHRAPRRIRMRFLASPLELHGAAGRVAAVTIERNRLALDEYGGLRARGTGSYQTLEAGMVLRAVGYRGVPLPGVPFDDTTYTISNIAGRVVHIASGEPLRGEYVVGWAKRGPSGVIGTNKLDAASTVAAMLDDLPLLPGIPDAQRDPAAVDALLHERGVDAVSYDDWKVLDRYEVARGAEHGRPRAKLSSVAEMMGVIRRGGHTM